MTKTALIFWGGWEGHEPQACADRVTQMLTQDGFQVDSQPGTDVLAQGDLGRFDLIVPMMTQAQIDPEALANLIAAIQAGTGLAGFHGGMGDTFRAQPAYQFMTGGQWVAHPGDLLDYRVQITAPDDPIMQGVGDFDYHSEQYYLHVDPGIDVLATTTFDGTHAPWTKGTAMPVVWKHRFGAGRVFYSALGHNAAELDHPQAQTILRRGLTWAAR
ncbi:MULTISPECIES: ThuA domain-containing protein [Paracoccus]|uniref:ThuA domain-containing protein n=1 Tax=Paracoccus TaxID=265 RepID=UPI00086C30E0|nr:MULTISPECIES: ThuA domain-containing protein [Paracoccus]ODT58472.1 MAG: hypothetical protein ABS73_12850 [Paracoccus sp. SCN 68-21]